MKRNIAISSAFDVQPFSDLLLPIRNIYEVNYRAASGMMSSTAVWLLAAVLSVLGLSNISCVQTTGQQPGLFSAGQSIWTGYCFVWLGLSLHMKSRLLRVFITVVLIVRRVSQTSYMSRALICEFKQCRPQLYHMDRSGQQDRTNLGANERTLITLVSVRSCCRLRRGVSSIRTSSNGPF